MPGIQFTDLYTNQRERERVRKRQRERMWIARFVLLTNRNLRADCYRRTKQCLYMWASLSMSVQECVSAGVSMPPAGHLSSPRWSTHWRQWLCSSFQAVPSQSSSHVTRQSVCRSIIKSKDCIQRLNSKQLFCFNVKCEGWDFLMGDVSKEKKRISVVKFWATKQAARTVSLLLGVMLYPSLELYWRTKYHFFKRFSLIWCFYDVRESTN